MSTITGMSVRIAFDDAYRQIFEESYTKVLSDDDYPYRINFAVNAVLYLEYVINILLNEILDRKTPRNTANTLTEALTGMNIKGKVSFIVPFMSDYKFVLDFSNHIPGDLGSLISIRNQLVHGKEYFKDMATTIEPDNAESMTFRTESQVLEKLTEVTIRKFYDAVTKYIQAILIDFRTNGVLKLNSFIIPNPKATT